MFIDSSFVDLVKLVKSPASHLAYTAADGGPFVGTIDLTSGVITPIVTGLSGPGGLVFVDTTKRESEGHPEGGDSCRDR
jgi:hypothetical protein